ncbi:hypothetical protein [Aureimonas glaciei]|nr:hypothetical protein [Aureimonas glaciei]
MVTFQPIDVAMAASRDRKGMLVLRHGLLVAVIVQLEDESHGDRYLGRWHVEATFDGLPSPVRQVFDDLGEIRSWIERNAASSRPADRSVATPF